MNKIIAVFLIFSSGLRAQCFTIGADLSYTNSVLANGGVYRDQNNAVVNATVILESVIANLKEYPDLVEEAQKELSFIKTEEAKRNSSIQN